MLTTEDEARAKWCVMVRQPFTQDYGHAFAAAAVNTAPDGARKVSSMNRCVTTGCMQWRWADTSSVPPEDRRGFCGMAGDPGFR